VFNMVKLIYWQELIMACDIIFLYNCIWHNVISQYKNIPPNEWFSLKVTVVFLSIRTRHSPCARGGKGLGNGELDENQVLSAHQGLRVANPDAHLCLHPSLSSPSIGTRQVTLAEHILQLSSKPRRFIMGTGTNS
jgi:hypothetical protein